MARDGREKQQNCLLLVTQTDASQYRDDVSALVALQQLDGVGCVTRHYNQKAHWRMKGTQWQHWERCGKQCARCGSRVARVTDPQGRQLLINMSRA